jgi:predicted transcriptional regulator
MANTTSLKLPDDLKEKIGALSGEVRQTPHAYMVEAIAEKVARDERRLAFLDAGLKSLAEFKRTGIAYTHEDVKRYLLARVAGKKARRPKPIRIPRPQR